MVLVEREPAIKLGEGAWLSFYHDPDKPDSPRYTELNLDGKPGSFVFSVPPHFHLDHAENTEVLEGACEFTLDGKTILRYGGDGKGPVHIPRRVVHSIRTWEGVPTKLRETTEPIGDFKEVFFRDMFQNGPGFWVMMRASYDYDGYIPFTGPLGLRWLDIWLSKAFGLLARFIAPPQPNLPGLDLTTPAVLSRRKARGE